MRTKTATETFTGKIVDTKDDLIIKEEHEDVVFRLTAIGKHIEAIIEPFNGKKIKLKISIEIEEI